MIELETRENEDNVNNTKVIVRPIVKWWSGKSNTLQEEKVESS